LWIVNADGTGAHPITPPGRGKPCAPAWSPSGQTIVFLVSQGWGACTGRIPGDDFGVLCTVHADGTNLRALTPTGRLDHAPRWTPDSRHIVFGTGSGFASNDLGIMDPDGTHLHVSPALFHRMYDPDVSADGTLAFSDTYGPETYGIYVSASGLARRVTSGFYDSQPVWKPTSRAARTGG
jgi:Tol biopolymer transport system component